MKIKEIPKNYNAIKIEEEVFRFWEKNKIYLKVKEKNKGKRKFYFLDGPPYVTNPIHVGNAWNKILKDAYLRYYRMKGFDVWDIPGYDMHGLPIEVQVEQLLKFKTKKDIEKFGIEKFINECRKYSLENLKIQEKQFKNLGVWMDWENPYMTIKNEYIEGVWYFIKKAFEKGLLFQGVQVVHWCPRCETVLAGYEVAEEYKEKTDPSIYVKFKLMKEKRTYLLVWTTTPWTLPSNIAIAVHPNETYIYALFKNDEILIFAKKRLKEIEKETGFKFKILKEIKGNELKGKRYMNPLEEFLPYQKSIEHSVILSEEYVTMNEGTGCVHIAPGHGKEDFDLGKKYNLKIISPVDASGKFTEEVIRYKNENVFNANNKIIEDLKSINALLYSGKITHRYPHCWRCKTPLILRISKQWFLNVPKIKFELIENAKKIEWHPKGALENRFLVWLEGAHEWALSRQRFWGIPLPIWVCKACDDIIVIGSIQELLANAINIPKSKKIDLHKPWIDDIEIKCNKCGDIAKKVPDVLDVWVDSGTASWSCLSYPSKKEKFNELFPADLIIEGPDQIRGWFYTLLVTSVVTFGNYPFKKVIIHGWSLDEIGRAMHKSLGNVIYPEEVIQKFGRDSLRIYELLNTTWEDLRFSITGLSEIFKNLNIIWNTFHFASLYMDIDKFNPLSFNEYDYLEIEDKWLIAKKEELKRKVTEYFEKASSFNGLRELLNFLLNDISRFYIRLIRRRVWIEKEDPSKNAVYYTLYNVLIDLLKMLAPFAPFITEAIYQNFGREIEKIESIHLCYWPVYKGISNEEKELINKMEIVKEIISSSHSLRMQRGIKLRKPIKKAIIVPKNLKIKNILNESIKLLKDQINAKEIEIIFEEKIKEEVTEIKIKLNYPKVGPVLKGLTKEIEKILEKGNPKEIKERIEKEGKYDLITSKGKVTLDKEMIIFTEVLKEKYNSIQTSYGTIYIDFTISPELESETLAREIIRRIQIMRKLLDLKINEKVYVKISPPSKEERKMLNENLDYIKNEVLGIKIELVEETELKGELIKEWEIDGDMYKIAISRKIY